MKPFALGGAALCVVGIAVWMLLPTGAADARVARVTRGDLVLRVEVEGTLAAVTTEVLSPPAVAGRWEFKIARMAPDGAEVRRGDEALAFDTSQLERQLLEMRAALDTAEKEIEKKRAGVLLRRRDDDLALAEARGKLEKAVLKLTRPEEFVAKNEVALLELDRELARKEVEYHESRRRLVDEADEVELGILNEERAQAALRVRELESGIARMTMTAPKDGTVIHVTNRRGEKKRVGDTVWRRDRVLEIPDLTEMVARGIVDESDAGRIAPGQAVELRLDAYPDVTFTGKVREIAKSIQPKTRNSPLRVVRLEIALDRTDASRMRPEMRFRGSIEVERREDVLLVPASAVTYEPSGPSVLRRTLGGSEAQPVDLGASNVELVEIVAGVAEGDEVVSRR